MKKVTLLLLLLAFAVGLKAQKKQLFDGGMMVHTGYLIDNIPALDYKASGMSFGLGGVLRFHVGNHVRLGGEAMSPRSPRSATAAMSAWAGAAWWPISTGR